jgi:hypothetical protein
LPYRGLLGALLHHRLLLHRRLLYGRLLCRRLLYRLLLHRLRRGLFDRWLLALSTRRGDHRRRRWLCERGLLCGRRLLPEPRGHSALSVREVLSCRELLL